MRFPVCVSRGTREITNRRVAFRVAHHANDVCVSAPLICSVCVLYVSVSSVSSCIVASVYMVAMSSEYDLHILACKHGLHRPTRHTNPSLVLRVPYSRIDFVDRLFLRRESRRVPAPGGHAELDHCRAAQLARFDAAARSSSRGQKPFGWGFASDPEFYQHIPAVTHNNASK